MLHVEKGLIEYEMLHWRKDTGCAAGFYEQLFHQHALCEQLNLPLAKLNVRQFVSVRPDCLLFPISFVVIKKKGDVLCAQMALDSLTGGHMQLLIAALSVFPRYQQSARFLALSPEAAQGVEQVLRVESGFGYGGISQICATGNGPLLRWWLSTLQKVPAVEDEQERNVCTRRTFE